MKINHINWYKKNSKKINKQKKEWQEKNKKRYRKYRNEWHKKKKQIDPKFHLDSNMAIFVGQSLKGKKAGRKWESLTGYSIDELMTHLEKQFDKKMNWDNYGSYWWIDHRKPRSLFNYTKPEDLEFKECWSLENLQPMEKIANIKKGNRQQSQEIR